MHNARRSLADQIGHFTEQAGQILRFNENRMGLIGVRIAIGSQDGGSRFVFHKPGVRDHF